VAALGARTMLLSATGNDEAAEALSRLLDADRIEASLLRDGSLTTTVKLRVIGRQQQLLRIDFETAPPNELLASHLLEFDNLLANADALVLSDYGKGGLAHIATMIERGRAAGKPVLVDPKGDDWERYRRATVITPNLGEFRHVAGRARDEDDLARRAQIFSSTPCSSRARKRACRSFPTRERCRSPRGPAKCSMCPARAIR
jgi:rfaE bifunctional protein kinase chain/domain